MVDYIRRSLAEEAIEEYVCRMCEEYNELAGGCISHAMHCPYLSGEEILKPVENEAVQPIRCGRWENDKCSECKKSLEDIFSGDFYYDYDEVHFCPNCGANMKETEV